MTKMKHFLRKFHIGSSGGCGGGAVTDDREHHDSQVTDDSPESSSVSTPSEQQPSTSTEETISLSSSVPNFSENSSNSNAIANEADYGLQEEEFQVELALAISVSDRDSREDTETAQIKTAKQISLGCQPSESLVDFISLQYWSYSVVNYDEKVMNGFYDVHGYNSNMMPQEKMPMLVDLQSICVADDVNYQVILVNCAVDKELRKLVDKVHLLPIKYSSSEVDAIMTILVQKIACIVVDKMGGPVNDAEEMPRKWTSRSYELKMSLNSIVLPIGCLDIGLSRHRALLFKVLADQINLPCMLVKGSYYSGTDDGAVNLIKFSNGSEYMIDLMGAPGTLIPSEVPSSHQDIKSDVTSAGDAAYPEFGAGNGSVLCRPSIHGAAKLSPFAINKLKEHCGGAFADTLQELYNCEIGNISLPQISEEPLKAEPIKSAVQHIHVEDVSTMVANTARNPEITAASFPILNIPNLAGKNQLLEGETLLDCNCFPPTKLSNNDQALPFTGVHLFSNVLHSPGGNGSSKLLTAQKDFWRPTFAPQENFSSSATGTGNVIVGSRADAMVSAGDFLEKFEETSFCHQSNSQRSQNEQVDTLLGGSADWEIPWEDLLIGERIGIGSYGEVHRAEWNGTEVAVKKLMNQDISGDALVQFKCEIEIMLRLRHPNLVLFMGAVTHPPNLSILTEYLPRGSLFKLLHRSRVQIDEKRRLRMAIDMAKGMNYLHTSHPVIVHRDLKTPNLLVDKNWVVKVCDFGMSRLKHHTFLSSKSTAGTAEWMAPEVLRNEPCNEKCDVYSFGVILWELATLEVPWTGMNSMQVVGAVGFQGRCLKIPDLVDPMVADLIIECWNPKPLERPSFAQILTRLKRLQHLVSPKTDAPTHQL